MIQASASPEESGSQLGISQKLNWRKNKFQYLIQSMVVGTQVRDPVDGYPPAAENYDKCINSLRMRFGCEGLLIRVLCRRTLLLVIKNVTNS
ncbi:hypothetical protein TNIN_199901 [Trichonephila inaurata madagascariensis]|uniref:Uncharacterized protein n=1 Tax=Trichonephila inaurata madagascariensis TaxID=2747483 RepID=A0A8X6XT02_9ARAC|nr:hypothetical protein TNIN_199901 [Trichonephila inaurata madagascariensis]